VAEARRIAPQELKSLIDQGKAVVLDVRRGSYEESDRKIPGAIRVDPARFQDYQGSLPQGRTVVAYCT